MRDVPILPGYGGRRELYPGGGRRELYPGGGREGTCI